MIVIDIYLIYYLRYKLYLTDHNVNNASLEI